MLHRHLPGINVHELQRSLLDPLNGLFHFIPNTFLSPCATTTWNYKQESGHLTNQDTIRTPRKSGHHAKQDTMQIRTPHKSGHHSNQDTMQIRTPRNHDTSQIWTREALLYTQYKKTTQLSRDIRANNHLILMAHFST